MNQYNLSFGRYYGAFLAWAIMLTEVAIAIPPENPLILDRQDPLIPQGYGKRELSSFEKFRIEREISRLEAMAESEYARGNLDLAMELWYRQLRLTGAIDPQAEIVSLGKIGALAWQENRSQDVRNIANRLIAIQSTIIASEGLNPKLGKDLAVAYQKVRYLDQAIDVYQLILARGNQEQSSLAETEIVDSLGKLYLAIFDYQNAAKIYQQKLQKNPQAKDREFQLQRLIKIYERGGLKNKAIATRKLLIKQYQQAEKQQPIPALKMANARDLESLEKSDLAIATYQEVLEVASTMQQLALAGEALNKIGHLYQQQQDFEKAIEIYQQLLVVRQQADNYYDSIDTYDILGKIYLQLEQPQQAKKFWELGLERAKTLNYKVKYFQQQLLLLKK